MQEIFSCSLPLFQSLFKRVLNISSGQLSVHTHPFGYLSQHTTWVHISHVINVVFLGGCINGIQPFSFTCTLNLCKVAKVNKILHISRANLNHSLSRVDSSEASPSTKRLHGQQPSFLWHLHLNSPWSSTILSLHLHVPPGPTLGNEASLTLPRISYIKEKNIYWNETSGETRVTYSTIINSIENRKNIIE